MAHLSPDAQRFYAENGYYCPLQVLSEAKADTLRQMVETFRSEHADDAKIALGGKAHLRFPELYDLVADSNILDAVESVIGPNILCWAASFFWKLPHDESFVSWHQDSTYWGLEPLDIVTAWVALSPSTRENGCMRVVPGTHKFDQLPHQDTHAASNLLSRGQEIQVEVNEADAVNIELQPGQMSLHHVKIVHGSEANPSPITRMGFAIRYIPTYVRQVGPRTSAVLVRGVDEYQHFDGEPRPAGPFDPAAIQAQQEAVTRVNAILYDGVA